MRKHFATLAALGVGVLLLAACVAFAVLRS